MRFGTFFFFQAVPWLTHDEVVRRELEQMEWTEELGFDQIWLTEHHFIDYGLAVDPATLAITRCAWPSRRRSSTSSRAGGSTSASAAATGRRSSAATTCHSRKIASASTKRSRC